MSKILEQATAHFRNQISGELQKITVPEWGADIFYKTTTTLKEEGKILELSQQGKTVEALVESLITRARNADGTRMFSFADKVTFMNEVDPKVLIRIVGEMNNVTDDLSDMEKIEKN
jgi:hypothetical protein